MKFYEMIFEEIESMIVVVDVGKFLCDQLECKLFFIIYLSYVVYFEVDYGIGIRISKVEEDGIYKCDCEGCDRIYVIRFNFFRYIFNKYNDKYKVYLIRLRKLIGQENILSKVN